MGAIDSMRFKKETVQYSIIFLAFALCYFYWFNEFFRGAWEYENTDVRVNYYFSQLFYDYLKEGIFTLWNPYFGLGTTAVVWSHLPINQYTILNVILNNDIRLDFVCRIIDFALLQVAMWMLCRYFKLNFLYAFIGVALFFLASYVKYFFFFGFKNNVFISLPLLILFTFLFMGKQRYKYLIYLIIALNFSFLGTKLEYWFLTCIWFTFFFWFTYMYFFRFKQPRDLSFKKVLFSFIIIVISTFVTNLWQIRILLNSLHQTSRVQTNIIDNIMSFGYIKPLLQTFLYSEIFAVGYILLFIYLIFQLTGKINKKIDAFSFVSGIFFATVIIKTMCIIQPGVITRQLDLIKEYSIYFEDLRNLFQSLAFQIFIFLLFLYALIRKFTSRQPIVLTAKELLLIMFFFQMVPYCYMSKNWFDVRYFQYIGDHVEILFLIAFMIGAINCHKNKIILMALINILFIYFMRTHVQILFIKIFNIVWHIQRDNQFIDIFTVLIALFGIYFFLQCLKELFDTFLIHRPVKYDVKIISLVILCIVLAVEMKDQLVNFKEPTIKKDYKITQAVENIADKIRLTEHVNYFQERNELLLDNLFRVNFEIQADRYLIYNTGKHHYFDFSLYDSVIPDYYRTILRKTNKHEPLLYMWFPAEVLRALNIKPEKIGLQYRDYLYNYVETLSDKRQLTLFNIKYIVSTDYSANMLNDKTFSYVGLTKRDQNTNKPYFYYYQYHNPLPRMYLVSYYQVLKDEESVIKTLYSDAFVPGCLILFDEMYDELKALEIDPKKFERTYNPGGDIKIRHYSPNRVDVICETPKDNIFVFSDLYDPRWKVYDNGIEKRILRGNIAFRAVALKKGSHELSFRYEIPYLKPLMILSIIIWTLFVSFTLFSIIKREKTLLS